METNRRFHTFGRCLLGTVVVLWFPWVQAATQWHAEPYLALGETLTDNPRSTPQSAGEYEFITEISPGISIFADGPRADLDLNYYYQRVLYLRDTNRDRNQQQLRFNGNAILLRDVFSVGANGAISRQTIDPEGIGTLDIVAQGVNSLNSLLAPENQTEVRTFSVEPLLRQRLGHFAAAEIRGAYNIVDYSKGLHDSRIGEGDAIIRSSRRFRRVPWEFGYGLQKVDGSAAVRATDFERYYTRAQFVVNQKWRYQAQVGNETYDFKRTLGERPGGIFWFGGFSWQPTLRTALHFNGGKRFDRNYWQGGFDHRTRHTTWVASYDERVITNQQLRLELNQEIVTPDGLPQLVSGIDDVVVQKRFSLSGGVRLRKLGLNGQMFHERRSFQSVPISQSGYGGTGGVNWIFGVRTTGFFNIGAQRQRFSHSGQADTMITLEGGATRQLRSNIEGTVVYRYRERRSNRASLDFTVNAISAYVTMRF